MADVYEIITDRIISQLESGTVLWHKPWNVGTHGGPQNLISKKEYRGVNLFLLSCMPYSMPYWVSYKQAQQLGGNVRKGEKSTPVVFWKRLTPIQASRSRFHFCGITVFSMSLSVTG